MAARIYSTLFWDLTAEGGETGYSIAAGYTLVLRDVVALSFGLPEDSNIYVSDSGTNSPLVFHAFIDTNEYFHWEGRQVIEGGDGGNELLVAYATGTTISSRGCGYLLSP